jgi:iduronate 2-sulfatase
MKILAGIKKSFLATSVIIVVIVIGLSSWNNLPELEVQKRPNIVFISIDDLGPNLGAYDNKYIVSPNIDEFANNGMTFRSTYCQAAVCAPSRASLMTGFRPDSTRVWHLGDKFRKIHPKIVTMPQHFGKHGYHTVCIGKIFHNYMPDSVSWNEPDLRPAQYSRKEWLKRDGETFYVNAETGRKQKIERDRRVAKRPNYYADGWNNGPAWEMEDVHDTLYYDGAQTELAKRTLSRLAKSEQPFFMALGYFRPHLPFAVPKKYWDFYHKDSLPLARNAFIPKYSPVMTMNSMYELRGYDGFSNLKHPSEHVMNEDTARILKQGYYASVSYVDALFGQVIQQLKDLDIYDNTIIVLWGDHGWKLGEHNGWCKQSNYNIDIHVPMIISSPNQLNRGKQTFGITELIDMYPSLCELAGIEPPENLQGTSFVPLIENPNRVWKKAAFSQFHRRPKVSPDGKRYMGYSMKTKDYHYVEWYYWNNTTKERGDFVINELYDSRRDPDENINIAQKKENSALVENLSKQLQDGWRAAKPDYKIK